MFKSRKHPVNRYIEAVLSGKAIVGELVRLAVERNVRDLESAKSKGWYFDEATAQVWIDFYSHLHHWKGPLAGKPVVLEPWQQFSTACVFGWKLDDGRRRFREAFEEVARKNGKTTRVAGVGLGGLILDQEAGAQVVSFATKEDQAKLVWNDAKKLCRRSPELSEVLRFFATSIVYPKTDSSFVPLGSDSETQDGLDIYFGIGDELHAHKSRALYDVVDSATGNRTQPLMWGITTAGFNRFSFCKISLHDVGERVLRGLTENDRMFFFMHSLDEQDDWKDESVWVKANPNLGVSVQLDDLRAKFHKALEDPLAENNFKCKHLNVWVSQETRWMPLHLWDRCAAPVVESDLIGQTCWSGLDLANTGDLAALVHVFNHENGDYSFLPRFFIPEERIQERSDADRVPYQLWLREGLVIATPGDSIDFARIRHQIEQDAQKFRIQEIGFDPYNATETMQNVESLGFTVVKIDQGYPSMSPPTKELMELVKARRIRHGGNSVLRWMADNIVADSDAQLRIRLSKKKSRDKIDGIVAGIMGLDRAIRARFAGLSVYENRGVLAL